MTRTGGFGVNKQASALGTGFPKNIEPNRPIFERPNREGGPSPGQTEGLQSEEDG